ncbi:hypothetical protein BKA67DRAFT_664679 [Truncatella angustata]|uniref:Uncharacterized protein n=1 Tax=Truncatella angustata TaxID=152316 RepID=A0A9P8RLX1_9PEZI|nr:uncharacterized protein BKA67DRAFT_664679 [Truncatella angustata]KAH6645640.1 hypothetical protein BKA67DRAFT_664679 [Truncatella angustata]
MVEIALVAARKDSAEMMDLAVNKLSLGGVEMFSRWVLPAAVNHECVLHYLLSVGIRPTPASSGAILNRAAALATPATFKLLLESGACLDAPGVYPLHAAAGSHVSERMKMMRFLVHGLNIEINAMDEATLDKLIRTDVCGMPLHYAVANGFWKRTKWLLAHGAYPNAKNQFGRTPFEECLVQFGVESDMSTSELGKVRYTSGAAQQSEIWWVYINRSACPQRRKQQLVKFVTTDELAQYEERNDLAKCPMGFMDHFLIVHTITQAGDN